MRTTSPKNNLLLQATRDNSPVKFRDFLKMFMAALICGMAVSAVVEAVALLPAHEACAAASTQAIDISRRIAADKPAPIPAWAM